MWFYYRKLYSSSPTFRVVQRKHLKQSSAATRHKAVGERSGILALIQSPHIGTNQQLPLFFADVQTFVGPTQYAQLTQQQQWQRFRNNSSNGTSNHAAWIGVLKRRFGWGVLKSWYSTHWWYTGKGCQRRLHLTSKILASLFFARKSVHWHDVETTYAAAEEVLFMKEIVVALTLSRSKLQELAKEDEFIGWFVCRVCQRN